jgi:hypothetical protein
MLTPGSLFLSLIKRLRNLWSHLNRWVEEQHFLEIEALTLNGPPPSWTSSKRVLFE